MQAHIQHSMRIDMFTECGTITIFPTVPSLNLPPAPRQHCIGYPGPPPARYACTETTRKGGYLSAGGGWEGRSWPCTLHGYACNGRGVSIQLG